MRIVIVGAGAIGGFIGARLTRAGTDVALLARGAHLRAILEGGLSVRSPEGDFSVRPEATDDLAVTRGADVLLLALKAHSLPAIAPRLEPLLGPDTVVVSMQNGLPWWYFQQPGSRFDGLSLDRVDPGGGIARAIEARRVVGSIVYCSTEIAAPGVVRHIEGNRISFGEPDGTRSARTRQIAEALIAAGFRCPVTTRIRHEIWVKLLGNVAFNPISALTRGTLDALVRDPDTSRVIRTVMKEAEAVAASLGITLPISIEQRIAGAGQVGTHKTSMLQDYEAGRPMELDAVVGAVVELGDRLGVPVPAVQAVYACARMLDAQRHVTNAGERSAP